MKQKKKKLREYLKEMGGALMLQKAMTGLKAVPRSGVPDPRPRLLSVPSRHFRIGKTE